MLWDKKNAQTAGHCPLNKKITSGNYCWVVKSQFLALDLESFTFLRYARTLPRVAFT